MCNSLLKIVFTARSELRTFCFRRRQCFSYVYEISREPLNGFALNSHGRRVWSFARTSSKVKIKGQRSRSPGTKGFFLPFRLPACGLLGKMRLVMAAVWNTADHYIFGLPCGFFLSSFILFSSPNLSGRRLDVYHTSTLGVALVRI